MNAFWWAFFAACVWGVVPILEKTGISSVAPLTALFYRCFGAVFGIVILGIFVVRPQHLKQASPKAIIFLVVSGFLASFVANILYYHGLKIGEVSKIVPVAGSFPLIAFILGVLILGESVTVAKVIGSVLIVSGLWLLR